ncbi:MAG: P63C domain-containing protein [Hyphomicrobiales bacterium]|nr:P63C domain-containing protein [Hyphomicrobiales bacterium]
MIEEDEKPSGRARGGVARAEALTPKARRDIAKKAAAARWGYKATHKGTFIEDFGVDVDCYVLDDEQKTAVISQRGMGAALGLGEGGSRLPAFIKGEKIVPFIGRELGEKLENPLVFQWSPAGANQPPPSVVNGYDVTILIDLCKAIIKADEEGKLLKRQEHIAKQAQIIVNASAKSGIKHLVYALSGYDATREEIIRAFKFYVQQEARDYEREFPNQLYREWYRLYELPEPERNKPWKFKHLTVNHVYWPLAKSNGKILELTKVQKAESGERHRRLHQFLSEVGVKALRQHLGRLLGIAEMSDHREQYERSVQRIFGEQKEFEF